MHYGQWVYEKIKAKGHFTILLYIAFMTFCKQNFSSSFWMNIWFLNFDKNCAEDSISSHLWRIQNLLSDDHAYGNIIHNRLFLRCISLSRWARHSNGTIINRKSNLKIIYVSERINMEIHRGRHKLKCNIKNRYATTDDD